RCTSLPSACSNSSAGTGRFSSARIMLFRSLFSSNGCRLLSLLIRRGITSSAVSNVVKRSLQSRHCRRLRTWRPSPARRESITLVSSWLQNGQNMAEDRHYPASFMNRKRISGGPAGGRASANHRRPTFGFVAIGSRIDGEAFAQVEDLAADTLQQHVVTEILQDVANPAGDLARFVHAEAARRDRRRAEPEPARDEGRARVARHRVLVDRD